ncbi:Uncharacterized protein TCM_025497 [Theobroma cacao]|uniref:RNase H type-1 domain-containing protein n=1 Tax=Theobroma cacao TaxID=3641 RepID=A0A061F6I7_THECC|nr:Uncharacterized protein TCM_025497 [Theobroma cacao]
MRRWVSACQRGRKGLRYLRMDCGPSGATDQDGREVSLGSQRTNNLCDSSKVGSIDNHQENRKGKKNQEKDNTMGQGKSGEGERCFGRGAQSSIDEERSRVVETKLRRQGKVLEQKLINSGLSMSDDIILTNLVKEKDEGRQKRIKSKKSKDKKNKMGQKKIRDQETEEGANEAEQAKIMATREGKVKEALQTMEISRRLGLEFDAERNEVLKQMVEAEERKKQGVSEQGVRCGLGNIYAPNEERYRNEMLEELKQIVTGNDLCWVLRGDFNTVRTEDERMGRGDVRRAVAQFNKFINEVKSNLQLAAGDGKNILFWTDWWIEEGILKDTYPRMYALATNKRGYINEYGGGISLMQANGGQNSMEENCLGKAHSPILLQVKTWKVWSKWKWEWGARWAVPNNMINFFSMWNETEVKRGEYKVWRMAFYAIAWSVWLHRNEMVFKGVVWDADKVYELSKLRVTTWAKAKWPQDYGMVLQTYQDPTLGKIMSKTKEKRAVDDWSKPATGQMKFNVDGAAQGCPRDAGIGGVLRDSDGRIKAIFSKTIGVGDASLAKVRAIREAFFVFAASKWSQTHKLIIESDSKNAVK